MPNNKILPLFCLTLAALLMACGGEKVNRLSTIELRIKDVVLTVETARAPEERAVGLMFRRTLGEKEGMLFIYERDERMYFYMKNTLLPLSIAFIGSDGVIVQIEDMRPLDETTIASRVSARYALEVNQGAFTRLGIGVGERVIFPKDFK